MLEAGMGTKRPCSVCGRWFEKNPRAAKHQKTCGPECRQELHRRRCVEWRARNPDAGRKRRLGEKLRGGEPAKAPRHPLSELHLSAARDAVGAEVEVVVEESARVLRRETRDAVRRIDKLERA